MSIKIQEYSESMVPAVKQFNARLREGGVTYQFPASHLPVWLPRTESGHLFQQLFVAQDENEIVRGGYCIKHQDFQIGTRRISIGQIALPLAEGTINRAYSQVGTQLLFHVMRQQPLVYALGMGGSDEAITRLVRAALWNVAEVPFFFRVLRAGNFLRNIRILRKTPLRRAVFDTLAWTGAASAIVAAETLVRRIRSPACPSISAEVVDEFSDWSDELWERARSDYSFIAIRDKATLRTLYPRGNDRFIRILLRGENRIIGWAVAIATDLKEHKQFGDMRLGSIVDGFSRPEDADKIVLAATKTLKERNVDLIVSNQSHRAWRAAMRSNGFYPGPSNFLLATSRKLTELLRDEHIAEDQVFMNRGDGDGPINL